MSISVKRPLNSIYLHIPFCKDKCYYCGFISLINKNEYVNSYINSLIFEITDGFDRHGRHGIKSIYIGGGTPSLLEVRYYDLILSKLHELFDVKNDTEITIEVNPGTINLDYLKELKNTGINRLSIGAQSFDDKILKLINRKHNSYDIIQTVELAKQTGFSNISIDLIYGLPIQDLKLWEETLEQAISLNIQHISAYGLKIEPGTKFAKNLPPDMPDEELSAQMYLKTIEILQDNGFNHYEISNYARKGFESRHNLSYWHNEEYFGFGLAAHGYVDGIRYSNTCDFDEYLKNPLKKDSEHKVTYQEAVEEGIFLGLRLIQGINIEDFNKQYNCNLLEKYQKVIGKYINTGFMKLENGYLKLTTEGILLSNTILADFLE